MPYKCLNIGLELNVRADPRAKKRAAAYVASGERWEFQRGMYGNVTEVFDHERFHWYRQDRPVEGQGDLFDGFLPFRCDYCKQTVIHITHIEYKSVYWYLVRPKLPSREWKRTEVDVRFACCSACSFGPLPLPSELIGYHMTELYQGGRLIFSQEKRT